MKTVSWNVRAGCAGAGLVIAIAFTQAAAEPAPAIKIEDYILIQKGTIPVIISAPHGGVRKIPDVPERKNKTVAQFATALDSNTALIAEKAAARLEKAVNGKPWLVIARFGRPYIDANRPPEGAYESEKAKPYYDAYHDALKTACKTVKEKFGRGLLLDIHGQGGLPTSICRGTRNGKSVTLLVERSGWDAVTGRKSILGMMERSGYTVFPECGAEKTAKEDKRYDGGFITGTYGSHTAYAIDAMQLEFGTDYRDKEVVNKTATDLGEAIAIFHDAYLKEAK